MSCRYGRSRREYLIAWDFGARLGHAERPAYDKGVVATAKAHAAVQSRHRSDMDVSRGFAWSYHGEDFQDSMHLLEYPLFQNGFQPVPLGDTDNG
jgi:hypothetical protein